jgi:hypothetical protein
MRVRRALLVAASLSASAACTSLLGDFSVSSSSPPGPEAGGDDSPVTVDGSPEGGVDGTSMPTYMIVAPDTSAFVGQPAKVDATGTSATLAGTMYSASQLSFSWTFASNPPAPGSGLSDQSIAGATGDTPSFTPDVPGVFKLKVQVSLQNAAPSTALVNVLAAFPQVLYAQGGVADAGPYAVYAVSDSRAQSAHPVLCPDTVVTSVPGEVAAYATLAGGRAFDFFEVPGATKFAAFTMDYFDAGNVYAAHLWAGNSNSACPGVADAGPLRDWGNTLFRGGANHWGSEPHFSPDGARFVVYDSSWNIQTYPSDPSTAVTSPNAIGPYISGTLDPRDLDPQACRASPLPVRCPQEPPRVEWSKGQLAWARPVLSSMTSSWEIVLADDTAGSAGGATQHMVCPGVTPRQFALLPDGTVIASYRQTPTAGVNIYRLKPAADKTCITDVTYTAMPSTLGAVASDFSISPDGKTLVYLALDPTSQDVSKFDGGTRGQLPGGYLYSVPVDPTADGGMSTPQLISTDPALFGPRWIGNGTQIVFTRLDALTGGGAPATSVVVIAANGGGATLIAQGDGVTSFASSSGSGACSAAPGGAGGAAGGALVSLVAALAIRRKKTNAGTRNRGMGNGE